MKFLAPIVAVFVVVLSSWTVFAQSDGTNCGAEDVNCSSDDGDPGQDPNDPFDLDIDLSVTISNPCGDTDAGITIVDVTGSLGC